MKVTLPLMLIVLMSALSCSKPNASFHMPAEWEPHEAVWLGWEGDSTAGFYPGITTLIKTLTPTVMVKIAVSSDNLLQQAKAYLYGQQIDSSRVKFYVMPGDRYWIRDHGAAFLVDEAGGLGVADFGFNLYGYPEFMRLKYAGNQDSIAKYVKRRVNPQTARVDSLMAVVEKAAVLKTDVVHEGGNIEVNGKGTLILCESAVFNRNPGRKKDELEKEYKRVLGVSNIIWLKRSLADDPNGFYRRIVGNYVGGGVQHADEFVRFANATTVLLAWVDEAEKDLNPVNRINYERMSENLRLLERATDQDGKPFTIVKVPLPTLIAQKIIARTRIDYSVPTLDLSPASFIPAERPKAGDALLRIPAASYLNYLVTNGLVILPTYTRMGTSKATEDSVRQLFQTYFPDRKIVFIDFMPQNWDGGGIHCSTQQQPAIRPQ